MDDAPPLDAALEEQRLSRLRDFGVLDTAAEPDFDDTVALAAQFCAAPIAMISFVDADRQWFKARIGLRAVEAPRADSLCAFTIRGDTVLQVPDAAVDPRFADCPLVRGEPFTRFYAGAPLITAAGHRLGSLSVIDNVPRQLTPTQCRGLQTLARHVIVALELRQAITSSRATSDRHREADRLKDEFLARITHELRTPLTSIHGYLETLNDEVLPPSTTARFMGAIRRNSDRLLNLVDDMLLAAQLNDDTLKIDPQSVDLTALAHTAAAKHRLPASGKLLDLRVDAPSAVRVTGDPGRLAEALDRLVANAIKFTSAGGVVIAAGVRDGRAILEVSDTGGGIAADERAGLFDAFRRTRSAEQTETQGAGLGLTIVKAIVDSHHGGITVGSAPGAGTSITITLPLPAGGPGQEAPPAAVRPGTLSRVLRDGRRPGLQCHR